MFPQQWENLAGSLWRCWELGAPTTPWQAMCNPELSIWTSRQENWVWQQSSGCSYKCELPKWYVWKLSRSQLLLKASILVSMWIKSLTFHFLCFSQDLQCCHQFQRVIWPRMRKMLLNYLLNFIPTGLFSLLLMTKKILPIFNNSEFHPENMPARLKHHAGFRRHFSGKRSISKSHLGCHHAVMPGDPSMLNKSSDSRSLLWWD